MIYTGPMNLRFKCNYYIFGQRAWEVTSSLILTIITKNISVTILKNDRWFNDIVIESINESGLYTRFLFNGRQQWNFELNSELCSKYLERWLSLSNTLAKYKLRFNQGCNIATIIFSLSWEHDEHENTVNMWTWWTSEHYEHLNMMKMRAWWTCEHDEHLNIMNMRAWWTWEHDEHDEHLNMWTWWTWWTCES